MAMLIRILAIALFMGTAAAAEPFDIQPYRDANGRFLAILAAGEGGEAKDLRTPEFARLVALMSDEQRFLRARKFSQADMPDLMDLCDMANRNDMTLLFFNVKSRIDPQWSQEEKVRKLGPLLQRNAVEFQAELTTLQPFHIRCMGLGMPLLEEFVRGLPPGQMTPVRREGLAKMRNGYTQMLTGMLMNMADAGMSVAYRGAVTEAMADASPALVAVMPLAERARLLEIARQSEPTLPRQFKPAHERVQAALQNRECAALCAF